MQKEKKQKYRTVVYSLKTISPTSTESKRTVPADRSIDHLSRQTFDINNCYISFSKEIVYFNALSIMGKNSHYISSEIVCLKINDIEATIKFH